MGGLSSVKEAFSDAGDSIKEVGSAIDDYAHAVVDAAIEDPWVTLATGGMNVAYATIAEAGVVASQFFIEEPQLPDLSSQSSAVTVTKRGADLYLPVIYGTRKVGGILLAPPFITGAENEYAHFVFALSEGEISAMPQVLINNIASTDAQYSGLVLVEKVLGTDTQASFPTLTSSVAEWTSNHRMLGTAAVHIRLKRDPEIFQGFPSFGFVVDGRKCYDPRTGTTIFTKNPIIHALDYYTNSRYGKGETVSDYTDWIAAANTCDAQITEYSAGGNISRFENNAVIDTKNTLKQNFTQILSSCRGKMRLRNGERAPYILDAGTSVFSFNSSNIDGGVAVNLGAKDNRLNKVIVSFVNPETWEADSQTWKSDTFKTEDGGYELSTEIKLPGETNKYRALDFAHTAAKKSRENMVVKFTSNFMAIGVEQGDIVDLTEEAYGITSKLFRVVDKQINLMTGKISFSLSEHFDAFYSRVTPDEQVTPADTGLPNPAAKLSAVSNFTLTTGDSIFTTHDQAGISVAWDAATDPYLNGYEVEYSGNGNTYTAKIPNANQFFISPVVIGASYTVKVYKINSLGMRGEVASSTITAAGESVPATPTSLTVTSGNDELLQQANGNILTRVKVAWTAATPRTSFEIQYKKTSNLNYVNAPLSTDEALRSDYLIGLEETVSYDIRIRANNKTTSSAWLETSHTVQGKTAPPPSVTTLTVTVMSDGTRVFDGTYANKPVDFAGYYVRYVSGTGGTWASMTDLTTDLIPAFPFETNLLPAGEYTLAVKAVDTSGIESTNAVYIESDLPDPRIGEILHSEEPGIDGYPGTKTYCSVQEDGTLQSDDKLLVSWDGLTTWDAFTQWVSDPELTISYEHTVIDVGIVTPFIVAVSHPGSVGSLTITESHSDDDVTYSSYAPIGSLITARYVKIKVEITHTDICVLSNLSIRLEADLIDETNNDEDTSLLTVEAGGGVRLPINNTYALIKNVYIAVQGSAANTTWSLIDKDNSLGPEVIFKNSSGTTVYPSIDYRIEGL